MKFSVPRIAIDLGTANSLVYVAGKGIVVNEPTVVAVTTDDNKVVAVGSEAKEMLGRTPGSIVASRPMKDGVIADYAITEAMLKYFINKVLGGMRIFRPEVMVCAPAGVTSVERRAVLDATQSAGAKTAYLIDESLAAAIGAGLPIAEPHGNMIVDIGGGTADIAVISLGGIVVHNTEKVGGNKLDESIANYIRKQHNLIIGERMAEEVKIEIGSALPLNKELNMEVKGRDAIDGLPKTVTITSTEVTKAVEFNLSQLVSAIKGVLEETPPELSSDIVDKGIVMSGGTSQLRNLDSLVSREIGVPVHLAENALQSVARGAGIAIENLDKYKRNITKN